MFVPRPSSTSELTFRIILVASASPALTTIVAPFGGDSGDSTTALTAEILGVDSNGRTTYALAQDEMQGSSVLVSATGTLVEGSDYFSYTYAIDGAIGITLGLECALKDGNAICQDGAETATSPLSSLGSWVLDVVSTAAPSGSTPSPSGSTTTPSGSGGSSSAHTAGPTQNPNSSERMATSILGAVASLLLVYQLF
ncbi:hypothetical protein B0H17DRAFT_1051101 [Mycena rosella]|uniref:Uncharacterized protein n=1 Tax=Mycena rosella TaxID=1033263 RepID=A0AAD7DSF3_MYCRO|nr:hypothetical protein B0H17DRAFT_1051101 [Mycena rosella]